MAEVHCCTNLLIIDCIYVSNYILIALESLRTTSFKNQMTLMNGNRAVTMAIQLKTSLAAFLYIVENLFSKEENTNLKIQMHTD